MTTTARSRTATCEAFPRPLLWAHDHRSVVSAVRVCCVRALSPALKANHGRSGLIILRRTVDRTNQDGLVSLALCPQALPCL